MHFRGGDGRRLSPPLPRGGRILKGPLCHDPPERRSDTPPHELGQGPARQQLSSPPVSVSCSLLAGRLGHLTPAVRPGGPQFDSQGDPKAQASGQPGSEPDPGFRPGRAWIRFHPPQRGRWPTPRSPGPTRPAGGLFSGTRCTTQEHVPKNPPQGAIATGRVKGHAAPPLWTPGGVGKTTPRAGPGDLPLKLVPPVPPGG